MGAGGPRHYTRWPVVEGYCTEQSYVAGDAVPVCCATRGGAFTAEVTRVGARRDLVWRATGLRAGDHDVPDAAWEHGCGWPVAFGVPTGADWPSGYYEIQLTDEEATGPTASSEAFFVLRAPADRVAPRGALLVLSTNTYSAYNQWGGRCMYSGATKVSFARPLERGYLRRPTAPWETDFDGRMTNIDEPSDPTHRRLLEYQARHEYPLWSDSSGWHNWERRFVRWAEDDGFVLDVAVNQDLIRVPDVLDGRRVLISVGHDEYWSWEMRDAVEAFVRAGGNWVILSGNTCMWQVRYEDDCTSMVSFKVSARDSDPIEDRRRLTSMWSDPLIGRPETQTTGLTFTRGGYHRIGQAVPDGHGTYVVHQPDHWAFAGLGLDRGDEVGAASRPVGYEVDGCALELSAGRPVPTHEDGAPEELAILATAPARLLSIDGTVCEAPAGLWHSLDPPGDLELISEYLFGSADASHTARLAAGHAVMGVFTSGAGTVFNAGSVDWAYGLDDDHEVQHITRNVLDRFGAPRVDQAR
jgi:hypothetical protein